jgi:hypothetical protein
MHEVLVEYVVVSYFLVGLLNTIIILFFDGKVSLESIFILVLSPISLPFILVKTVKDFL